MDTLTTVQQLIAAEADLKPEDLPPGRPLEELGVDSLSVLMVAFKIEDTFGVKMPEDRVPLRTLQDIADLVDRLVAEQSANRSITK
ncbi:MAG: acyl carrier protein [Betaproteobacteria bacterium]|nr:MAG: acyl carrier protein [Betaproteobacteria bacterium]